MSDLLTDAAIDEALAGIRGWSRDGEAITRTWERKGFNGAVQLANVAAFLANELNHHPDIRLHDYKHVTITTTTHAAGGITDNDLTLARKLNEIVDA